VASIAVILGHRAKHLLNPRIAQRVAAVLFALVGVALMTGIL
jgi:putative Ca2+/H+ antiporter (TMEM165/GDT1 family)